MTHENAEKLISFARQFVGVPYERGARLSEADEKPDFFDCSSFVQYIFRHIGIDLPRSSIQQASEGPGEVLYVEKEEDLLPGDILFMRSDRGYYHDEAFGGRKIYVGHVALYCGDGMIIHSKKSLGGVVLQKLSELQQNPNYEIGVVKRFL